MSKRPRAPLTGQKSMVPVHQNYLRQTWSETKLANVIVFLDQASLETVKTAKGYELLP